MDILQLGTGAFSIVRAAINKRTHERVAVKIINKAGLPAEDEKDLKQEVCDDMMMMMIDGDHGIMSLSRWLF
jgi:serine/threonine protein kinase